MMKRLNGWKRLWIVFYVIWFMAFIWRGGLFYKDFERDELASQMIQNYESHSPEIIRQIAFSVIIAFIGPLIVYLIIKIIVWIRDGFINEKELKAADPGIKNTIEDPPKVLNEPIINSDTKVKAWPKWDWSDWLNILLIGYVAHIITASLLAVLFRINTPIHDPISSIASHLPLFVIFYLIKMGVISSYKIIPINKNKIFVVVAFFCVSSLFTLIPSVTASMQQQ